MGNTSLKDLLLMVNAYFQILAHSQAHDIDLIVAGSCGFSALQGW